MENVKFFLIRIVGSLLSCFSLLWMPWCIRTAWAKLLYQVTYVDPKKYPTYMKFIEETNARYNMGKRTKNAYVNIVLTKERHE